jgi:large-conductance mechanosensitive channel
MTFPIIVDVSIGMIIIYLSAAVVVSGVQELLATLLKWRSQHLKESILQIMLDQDVDDEELKKAESMRNNIYKNPLIQSMNHRSTFVPRLQNIFSSFIYKSGVSETSFPQQNDHTISNDQKAKELEQNSADQQDNMENINDPSKNVSTDLKNKKYSNLYKRSYSNCNPSYIDNKVFALSIMKELSGDSFDAILSSPQMHKNIQEKEKLIHNLKAKINENNEIPRGLKESLLILLDRVILTSKQGENMVIAFQSEIEGWFDSSMDRASGVYKRNSQFVAFVLSLILVVFFNLDSLYIAEKLLNDSTLRDLLADNASVIVTSSKIDPSDPNSQLDSEKLQININNILGDSLPIIPIYENSSNFSNCPDSNNCTFELSKLNFGKLILAIVGWGITTLAVFMGAPFWFQLLSKFVNIRSSGNKP